MIAKLLYYRDRDILLRRAREVGHFKIDNASVTLFPDFTVEVQSKRASYLAVKRALKDAGVQCESGWRHIRWRAVQDPHRCYSTVNGVRRGGADGIDRASEPDRHRCSGIRRGNRLRRR
ncbi:hypothetical protein NDU88_010342 [Pleurodeles waltl]|uniref:Uncharacterized protein n=1 Tax=Pleurodeles waltl TaxID=8319 RepID=A0AAV7PUL5_PLEWA|nr:hypothetical protein NDU88_010342 [Pleurodeles waltl]